MLPKELKVRKGAMGISTRCQRTLIIFLSQPRTGRNQLQAKTTNTNMNQEGIQQGTGIQIIEIPNSKQEEKQHMIEHVYDGQKTAERTASTEDKNRWNKQASENEQYGKHSSCQSQVFQLESYIPITFLSSLLHVNFGYQQLPSAPPVSLYK